MIDKLRTGRVKYLYDKPAIRENGWFFVCSGGTAACGEEGGCNTVMQKRRATPEARLTEKEKET